MEDRDGEQDTRPPPDTFKSDSTDQNSTEPAVAPIMADGITGNLKQQDATAGHGASSAPGSSSSYGPMPLTDVAQYQLHSIIRHKGISPHSGHYVADVRDHKVSA